MIKIRNVAAVLALVILSGAVGYDIGRRKISVSLVKGAPGIKIENRRQPDANTVDFSLFWEVWSRVEHSFIDKEKIDPQKMVWGAAKGMVASLDDPYTVFLPPEENKRAQDDLAGSFEGIGAQLGIRDKRIIVVAPLKGMPAEKAGIRTGDFILKVDGEDTAGWTLPEAVSNIRGPKGTKVVLNIFRDGASDARDITVKRGTIKVPSIETELAGIDCRGGSAGCAVVKIEKCGDCARAAVLRLFRFGGRTNEEWENAVEKIVKFKRETEAQGNKFAGVVFDLRNNPGGYLQGAVYVASEFIDSGVIVRQQMTNGTVEEFKAVRKGRLTEEPLVVLINGGSASASEIVAGAIKDHNRGILVGTVSFGKGSVQEAQDLPGGAGLHVTTAKWLLPSGKWIDKNGISPDVSVENSGKSPEKDLQLEKALELLLNRKKR